MCVLYHFIYRFIYRFIYHFILYYCLVKFCADVSAFPNAERNPIASRFRWDVRQSVEVSNFKTSWADHFNMPKEYFNQEKPPTIDVLVKLLSRTQAPCSTSPEVAGGHIDALTSPRHGVAW